MSEPFRYPWEDTLPLHDYQRRSVRVAEERAKQTRRPRICLYYKTGAGKTRTALSAVRAMNSREAVVVAPPTTHDLWHDTARRAGVSITVMSHAKFRKRETKLSRQSALIVDEFHMLGGYKAQGFKRLESVANSLEQPIVICSATPNYNDVERCYCIQRIVDPHSTRGGYLSFIYQHCATEVNPWGHVPKVIEFIHYPDAATFLADMPHVEYIEDDLVYDIEDVEMDLPVPEELLVYGIDRRAERMVASAIERKHRLVQHMLVNEENFLPKQVEDLLVGVVDDSPTPVLVFAVHKGVAAAATRSLLDRGITSAVVTGQTSPIVKSEVIEQFKQGRFSVLAGTQTLATGTDGLDKMCDTMVILDDTEDNAMRRQLIGRIMPRGSATTEPHSNRVIRLVPEPSPRP